MFNRIATVCVIYCSLLGIARSEIQGLHQIKITIGAGAKGLQPDPTAKSSSDGAMVYSVQGLINSDANSDGSKLIQGQLDNTVARMNAVGHAKDATGLLKMYDPTTVGFLAKNIVNKPLLLDRFFAQLAEINHADWRFLIEDKDIVTIFSEIKGAKGEEAMMPFTFKEIDGKLVPIYQTDPSLMFLNILVAQQQKLIKTSE